METKGSDPRKTLEDYHREKLRNCDNYLKHRVAMASRLFSASLLRILKVQVLLITKILNFQKVAAVSQMLLLEHGTHFQRNRKPFFLLIA